MPLHDLTPQERRAYSAIPDAIDEPSQRRFFVLSAADERLMGRVKGRHNRLGRAHHLGWLRWLGRQPGRDEVRSGPASLTVFLARQLNVAPEAFQIYPRDRGAWSHHQALAREHLGWRAWSDTERQALLAWLIEQAQQHDQPRGLVKDALGFLRREKIVRPGLTTVERLVAHAREEAGRLLEHHIYERLLRPQVKARDALIQPTGSGEASRLTELLAAPPNASARSLNHILARISEMRELGVEVSDGRNPPTQRGQQLLQTEWRQGGASTETQHREGSPGSDGKARMIAAIVSSLLADGKSFFRCRPADKARTP